MGGDPSVITSELSAAKGAFDYGDGEVESGFSAGLSDEETQLRKGCRLLSAAESLRDANGYHTAIVELSFGILERSFEFYALAVSEDELRDFSNHTYAYERASELGVITTQTRDDLIALHQDNRSASYYGDRAVRANEAAAMFSLAQGTHEFLRNHPQDHYSCLCE